MALLGKSQLKKELQKLPSWKVSRGALRRTYTFDAFAEGIAFVGRVARRADLRDHHPDIDIRWTRVSLALSTHSEGGITAKDTRLAGEFDAIHARHFGP
jgi:4a-hydroxytetrahydrobiopterin dehydratase